MKPNIRFSKFSRRWELHKLTDMVSLYRGLTYTPSDVCNAGTLVLRSSNVQDGEICLSDNVYVKSNIVNTQNVNIGDIIVVVRNGSRSLIGKHAQIKYEMPNTVIGAFMTGICSNAPSFINSLLSSNRFDEEVEKNLGATINQITNGTFNSMKFYFPNRDEQFAIGTYFDNIDAKLQASAKKVEALKKLKSASLISMFPQNGESTPKVRFKGFEGEWSKQSATDLFLTIDERNRPELPVLSACQDVRGMIPREKIGFNVSHDTSNEVTYKRVQPGQFVIHLRSFQGGFAHSSYDGIISPAYTVFDFKDKERHDDYYWKIVFMSRSFIDRLRLITYGIRDGRSISFNEFKDLSFQFPSKAEQQAIATFFRSLDRKIALETARLEKLKQIKLACLDKMFV